MLEEMGCAAGRRPAARAGMHMNVRDRAALDLHRSAPRGAGTVARGGAARAGAGEFEMVEGGAARRVPRLQPEREGSNDLFGVFGPAAAGRARLDAARVGRGARLRAGRLHRADDAEAFRRDRRSACGHGRRAGVARSNCWNSRRETKRQGLGDAPWPPHFRKMEGEAPRVAPSRAKTVREVRRSRARTKMPLIVVANSPNKASGAGRPGTMESKTCRGAPAARRGRCAGRFDARQVVHLDPHPRQSAPCAARSCGPPTGNARSG